MPRGREIRLHKLVSGRIDQAIDRMSAERVESHTGSMRQIDLDRRSFILRNTADGREVPCEFEEDLLEVAKDALDRQITVTGSRRVEEGRRAPFALRVTRIEVIDEQDEEGALVEPGATSASPHVQ